MWHFCGETRAPGAHPGKEQWDRVEGVEKAQHGARLSSIPMKNGVSKAEFGEGDKGEAADTSLPLEIYLNQRIILERQHAQQWRSPS